MQFLEQPALVVTSISSPNDCLRALAQGSEQHGMRFICIGDKKSPDDFQLQGCEFINYEQQLELELSYSQICPANHYARKNVGYLVAMQGQPQFIRETDDDNAPRESFFASPQKSVTGRVAQQTGWLNVYAAFEQETCWPRGFPLDHILSSRDDKSLFTSDGVSKNCLVQQCLADGDPDVDAIYRLTHNQDVIFSVKDPVILGHNQFCPFNSQNTTWFPEAYYLLYLPATVTMRMTDIWRGFIAQICLYAMHQSWSYHAPTVDQIRNQHDLVDDLRLEIPGYLDNKKIMDCLSRLPLSENADDIATNLRACYTALIDEGVIDKAEMELLDAWISDCQNLLK